MSAHMRLRTTVLALIMAISFASRLAGPATASPPASPAPFNTCLVISLYGDLLGRPPDPTELSAGLSFLISNGRAVYATSLLLSDAYRGALIQRDYQAFLGRPATDPEVAAGIAIFNSPGSAEQLVAAITGMDEYDTQARVGGDNANLVRALYHDLLGRAALAADINFGTGYLSSHTRQAYIALLLTSLDYSAALIKGWYSAYLERQPTALELSSAQTTLSGGRDEDVRASLLRLLLWANGVTPRPRDYPRFLDYAADRVLLRKLGGGYIFIHPLLMDYLAGLEA